MKFTSNLTVIAFMLISSVVKGQLFVDKKQFTDADTLRGSLNKNRNWWDVIKYELDITPDINAKSVEGKCTITYKAVGTPDTMQIDLQNPLVVDSIVEEKPPSTKQGQTHHYNFKRDRNTILVKMEQGLVWSSDNGSPFVATACQGLGASVWWPCKDHQSDEPDSGAIISITAPDTLVAVSNGRLLAVTSVVNGNKTWTWQVRNPINIYDITMNIGKYVNFTDTIMGLGGKLDLSYWVLDHNLENAKTQFIQVKPMLHCFEYWFGKYPFYEDSYKLVETPFAAMEHQSAIAYGHDYTNGYLGRSFSLSRYATKFDNILMHESAHEWFGNSITSADIADMWLHEGFATYSEALFVEWLYGDKAGAEYLLGTRGNILNDKTIIGIYGVNKEGSATDMYFKAANMLQNIRNSINDDAKFRAILRGLNKTFFHQIVTTKQVEQYIIRSSGIDFSKTFEQYLRTRQIPTLEYCFSPDKKNVVYKWTDCVKDFNFPLVLTNDKKTLRIYPTETPKSIVVKIGEEDLWEPTFIEWNYYIKVRQVD